MISRPQDQLLHYPAHRDPPGGFSSHVRIRAVVQVETQYSSTLAKKITISNYSGEARDYIKKLISLLDADFTPTMTSTNTAVIAA